MKILYKEKLPKVHDFYGVNIPNDSKEKSNEIAPFEDRKSSNKSCEKKGQKGIK